MYPPVDDEASKVNHIIRKENLVPQAGICKKDTENPLPQSTRILLHKNIKRQSYYMV